MCALVAWAVLFLRFFDMLIIGEHSSIAETLFVYFGYFTVWANIFIALAFTAPLLNPDRKLSNFVQSPYRAKLLATVLRSYTRPS
jgi:hypothetical protein